MVGADGGALTGTVVLGFASGSACFEAHDLKSGARRAIKKEVTIIARKVRFRALTYRLRGGAESASAASSSDPASEISACLADGSSVIGGLACSVGATSV